MNATTSAERVLIRGLDDWVSLAEVVACVRSGTSSASDDDVRKATISVLSELLHDDLLRIGDLSPGFVPWELSGDAAVAFIEKEWKVPPRELDHAHGWWFENTGAGDDAARSLTREHHTPRS